MGILLWLALGCARSPDGSKSDDAPGGDTLGRRTRGWARRSRAPPRGSGPSKPPSRWALRREWAATKPPGRAWWTARARGRSITPLWTSRSATGRRSTTGPTSGSPGLATTCRSWATWTATATASSWSPRAPRTGTRRILGLPTSTISTRPARSRRRTGARGSRAARWERCSGPWRRRATSTATAGARWRSASPTGCRRRLPATFRSSRERISRARCHRRRRQRGSTPWTAWNGRET